MRISILAIIAFILTSITAGAQIKFEHLTLAEAMVKAKKENKPLFVDVHATWCGPCKRMAATAFVDPVVSQLYNKNFINVKIDGEKADGPAVMQQYGITAYPTLLYLNADGTIFRKVVGGMTAEDLLKRGNEAIHPDDSPLWIARKKYYSSNLELVDLREFIGVMIAEDGDSLGLFASAYFNVNQSLNLKDEIDFNVFYQQENDLESKNSTYFLTNPSEFPVDAYTGKIKEWINQSFATAIEKKDYSIVELVVIKLYPYWEKAETLDQDQVTYLAFVKEQYERYANQ